MNSDQRKSALAKLLKHHDLSNKEAAKKLKVTPRTISRARNIERQSSDISLQRILEAEWHI